MKFVFVTFAATLLVANFIKADNDNNDDNDDATIEDLAYLVPGTKTLVRHVRQNPEGHPAPQLPPNNNKNNSSANNDPSPAGSKTGSNESSDDSSSKGCSKEKKDKDRKHKQGRILRKMKARIQKEMQD